MIHLARCRKHRQCSGLRTQARVLGDSAHNLVAHLMVRVMTRFSGKFDCTISLTCCHHLAPQSCVPNSERTPLPSLNKPSNYVKLHPLAPLQLPSVTSHPTPQATHVMRRQTCCPSVHFVSHQDRLPNVRDKSRTRPSPARQTSPNVNSLRTN
jgi:hypothetical protein